MTRVEDLEQCEICQGHSPYCVPKAAVDTGIEGRTSPQEADDTPGNCKQTSHCSVRNVSYILGRPRSLKEGHLLPFLKQLKVEAGDLKNR